MNYALITGAAKGIGSAIAGELAHKGYGLLLVDIDGGQLKTTAEYLQHIFSVPVLTLQTDLSSPGSAGLIKEWSRPYHPQLQVLVNNAGFGLNGNFETIPIDEQLSIVNVNIKAQLSIAHAFLPILRQQEKAYLLNVGSTTCYQSVPYLSVYAASKAFVISFTRSLRFELKTSPVSVSCLIPGSTDTDFVKRAGMGAYTLKTAERFNMTAEQVGKIAVKGLFKGKAEIIPGFSNRLHAFFPRFFPKSYVEKIAGNIYRPRDENKPAAISYT
ncbi:MAG: SDR family oxidoreductase [Sphingobacteriales bacterium]|nr:SDR family oxidoreductase [Sphingobacteriales bacterium]